jgi:maltose alpha-D-glucosyltransferase / alpha-amylase
MMTLGRRTAELHAALATAHGDPAFAPEPIAPEEPGDWAKSIAADWAATLQLLRQDLGSLSGPALATAGTILAKGDLLPAGLSATRDPVEAMKTRLHGNFHLGQALIVGSDVMLIGFGAGPTEGIEVRRSKGSPLKDVASLLRSLDYAAATAIAKHTAERSEDMKILEPLARSWETVAREAFMAGYRERILGCPSWPAAPGAAERLIDMFCLELVFREVREELANRPDWAKVPLERLLKLMTATVSGDATP